MIRYKYGEIIQLTDEMIINSLNTVLPFFILKLLAGIAFLVMILVAFIKFKKEILNSRRFLGVPEYGGSPDDLVIDEKIMHQNLKTIGRNYKGKITIGKFGKAGGKISIIIAVFTSIIVLGYGKLILDGILTYNAIKYSIENDSLYVDIDTITRTGSPPSTRNSDTRYVVLNEYGKISVDESLHLVTGESVYVVIAEGRFGGTYAVQIYPTDKYNYEK